MVVQGTVQGGTSQYKAVHGGTRNGTRQYKTVCTGMYWYVLILTVQLGYAALLLDSLLQFCPADIAVLETSASNDSNASSSMFQSSLVRTLTAGPGPTL